MNYLRGEISDTKRQRDFFKAQFEAISSQSRECLEQNGETIKKLRAENESLGQQNATQRKHINSLLRDHQERFIATTGEEPEDSRIATPNKLADAERCIDDLQERVKKGTNQNLALYDIANSFKQDFGEAEAENSHLREQITNMQACIMGFEADAANSKKSAACQHQDLLIAKTAILRRQEAESAYRIAGFETQIEEQKAEVHECYNMLMQEQANNAALSKQVEELQEDIEFLRTRNSELTHQLNFRAFGEDKKVAEYLYEQIIAQNNNHLSTYARLLDERDQKIDRLDWEIHNATLVNLRHEDTIDGLKINNARYEAIVRAMEERFGLELRAMPLTIDLRPCLREFREDQMRIMAQVDSKMYRLADMKVNQEEFPEWMM